MRLGYFGGSFDPPHLGHLAVARGAAENFALDQVLFVPTARQPLKPHGACAPYADRLAMVELLCRQDPRFSASDLEAPLSGPQPNYTVETLQRLHAARPGAEIYVIVGADAFAELPRWREPDYLLQLAEWIVVTRPANPARHLPPLTQPQRLRVHPLATVDHPASATGIRAALAAGTPIGEALLPPEILSYINTHHLYAAE